MTDHIFEALKTVGIGVVSWGVGVVGGFVAFFFQSDPEKTGTHWYQHPAVVSAVVTTIGLILIKAVDYWRTSREDAEEEEDRHATLSEKREEMLGKELAEILNRRDRIHERELGFEQQRSRSLMVEMFQLRQEKHRALNYAHTATLAVGVLREMCARGGIDLSDFNYHPKSYEELMHGIDDAVETYRKSLTVD